MSTTASPPLPSVLVAEQEPRAVRGPFGAPHERGGIVGEELVRGSLIRARTSRVRVSRTVVPRTEVTATIRVSGLTATDEPSIGPANVSPTTTWSTTRPVRGSRKVAATLTVSALPVARQTPVGSSRSSLVGATTSSPGTTTSTRLATQRSSSPRYVDPKPASPVRSQLICWPSPDVVSRVPPPPTTCICCTLPECPTRISCCDHIPVSASMSQSLTSPSSPAVTALRPPA